MTSGLCIVSSVALVMSVLSSPIRSPQTPNGWAYPNYLSLNFALAAESSKESMALAFAPAPSVKASFDADGSDFDDENEEKSFWSFSLLVSPAFLSAASPPRHLSARCPGSSPAAIVAVPLRC